MIKEKRMPTLIGLSFLVVSIFAGVFLLQRGNVFFLRATPEITPSQIRITNLTDSSYTVSWITEKETNGFLNFGETNSLGMTVSDERDQVSGSTGSFQTHYVSLENLKPKTTYYFKIGSGGVSFDDSGKPYEVTTAPVLSGTLPPNDTATGTILRQDGSFADGAIVYLKMANTTDLSSLVRSSGTWIIPLNTALSSDLNSYASYDKEAQVEEIFVQDGSLGVATAMTTTKNDNPVPEITLGKTYDFRKDPLQESLTPTPEIPEEPNPTPSSSGFSLTDLNPPQEATKTGELEIINPANNEKIATQRPEFIGTGPAGQTIQIIIESPSTYKSTVKTDSEGNWEYTPPADLAPGLHTITAILGGERVTRTFTVLAAGDSSLPSFTATPSGTALLTPTLTPTLTMTPTSTPSARTAMPATESGVPESGLLTPTFSVVIMGLLLIVSGFIVKILAHAR